MVILKKVYEYYLNKDVWEVGAIDKITFDFINEVQFEKMGWVNSLIEGGFISPDLSTIFYYGRTPYEGQLVQFSNNKEGFEEIKSYFLKTRKFIEVK